MPRVIHCISPVQRPGSLFNRQELFLESVDRASKSGGVVLLAAAEHWHRPGWTLVPPPRNASILGDRPYKPFLRDLFDRALEFAGPSDWLYIGNVDCAVAPDFYDNLASRQATVVEYLRRDVEGNPATLDELFTFPNTSFETGVDGLAIRANLYRELRPNFPDFVLGEPHWDTTLSGILRNLLPVQRDHLRLFHPAHEQKWDLSCFTPAGAHNNAIYIDAVNFGFCRSSVIGPEEEATDTAVIVASFGNDPMRHRANSHAVRQQLDQDLWVDTYLLELLADGQPSAYPDEVLTRVNHIKLRDTPASEGIFQKEAMYNIGWKQARARGKYKYFIFVDADVHCKESDWFRRIRARLQENPAASVQGFGAVVDSVDPAFRWSSIGSAFCLGRPNDLTLNPGVCWGLRDELLSAAGGFNPYSLGGAGDSLFVAEFLNEPELPYDPWVYEFGWFRELYRDLPFRAQLESVHLELVHEYHGPLAKRNYDGVRYAMASLPPVREWLTLDGQGLVVWKNPDGLEKQLCQRRNEMSSREDVERICAEYGLHSFDARRSTSDLNLRPKPLFRIPGWRPQSLLVSAPIPKQAPTSKHRLNVFDPKEVYRDEFPFSWAGNVRTTGSTHLPTEWRNGVPTLVLDPLPGVTWIGAVLPLEANWQNIDLRKYDSIHFTLKLEGPQKAEMEVVLTSMLPDGVERDSTPVSLNEFGLRPGRQIDFAIPLERFLGPACDLSSIRTIKWIGRRGGAYELSRIYVDCAETAAEAAAESSRRNSANCRAPESIGPMLLPDSAM